MQDALDSGTAEFSKEQFEQSPLYYTRTRGLFRECFPGEKTEGPKEGMVELYMSPVETWCRNLNYYIPDENDETIGFPANVMTRIREFSTTAGSV